VTQRRRLTYAAAGVDLAAADTTIERIKPHPPPPTGRGGGAARHPPVAFVSDGSVRPQDLVWACLTVGYERLVGVLDGGIGSWADSGREVATIPLVEPDAVGGRRLVDVRQRSEYEARHVSGAHHVELGSIVDGNTLEGSAVVHCGHGERAMSAASLLVRAGDADVAVLLGGPDELSVAGYRLETGS
jgi:hydroxyacylglutathione hydrolase